MRTKVWFALMMTAVVSVWAIVMIFFIPLAGKAMGLAAPVIGAWIGTSEFADAAGYAAAAAIGEESAIQAFTLMKVIGRDIWIGIWCFVLSIVTGQPPAVPPRPARAGQVEVWSRVLLADGLELQVQPGRAGIRPEQLRRLVAAIVAAYEHVRQEEEGQ